MKIFAVMMAVLFCLSLFPALAETGCDTSFKSCMSDDGKLPSKTKTAACHVCSCHVSIAALPVQSLRFGHAIAVPDKVFNTPFKSPLNTGPPLEPPTA